MNLFTVETVPILETKRLILRPFRPEDAPKILTYLSDARISFTMHSIPHPCTMEWVQAYLRRAQEDVEHGRYHFAIDLKTERQLVGRINIRVQAEHQHAEIGYWMGVPHWDAGYTSEAGQRIVRFGFADLGLHRIMGTCFSRNQASARVLQKIGMHHEITMRQDWFKDGVFEDSDVYGILRSEWKGEIG